MKKFLVVLFLSMMCVLPFGVDALESNSYTTLRGVTVEKSLYDKMCNMYSVNFVETLSQEEFDNLSANIDTAVKETYIDYYNGNIIESFVYPYSKAIAQALVIPVPSVNVEEIPYEELQNIPSERGIGALGSSNK